MAGYLEQIKDKVTTFLKKPKAASKSVNKKNLIEDLNMSKKRFEIFSSCISDMPMSYRKSLADKIFDLASTDKTCVGCIEYVTMAKAVAGNDLRVYFATFEKSANNFIDIVAKVQQNFGKIFDSNEVRIHNITLSQFAVFGMIEQATIFSNFASYLLDMVSNDLTEHDGTRELNNVPQYKVVYVNEHRDLVYELALNLKTGYVNYLNSIAKIVNSSSNVKMVGSTGTVNVGMIDPDEHMNNFFLRKALFNPFFFLGESWVILKNLRFQKNVREKEYLESHVALLKLEMDGMSPDSPEYQHHVKVINAYNEMIAKLDKRISEYENSN
jgi:orotate phosphoribosyltransferase-like protein